MPLPTSLNVNADVSRLRGALISKHPRLCRTYLYYDTFLIESQNPCISLFVRHALRWSALTTISKSSTSMRDVLGLGLRTVFAFGVRFKLDNCPFLITASDYIHDALLQWFRQKAINNS